MNDYLDSRTLKERLETYLNSEEFEQDLYLKAQEYTDANIPVPPDERLREEVLAENFSPVRSGKRKHRAVSG